MSDLRIIAQIEQEAGGKLEQRELEHIYYPNITGYSLDKKGNISGLNLNGFQLEDYSFVKKLTDLKVLCVAGADLHMANLHNVSLIDFNPSEYTFFHPLQQLIALDLSRARIININFLKHIQSLQKLRLNGIGIFKNHQLLNPLTDLAGLTHLEISTAGVRHIQIIGELKTLEHLDLEANDIDNLYPLKSLTNLNYLDLSRNDIVDIQPLSGLDLLSDLDLSENEISDLNPLKNLTKLHTLNLNQNRIKNITPIEKLNSLVELYLGDNEITNIDPLVKLNLLQELDISHNRITDSFFLERLKKIPQLYADPMKEE